MKEKKNNLLSVLALILALAALALSAVNFANQPEDQTYLIDDLYEENRQLYLQVQDLEQRLQQLLTVANLQSWELGVQPWADSTGADITFAAVPTHYQPGVSATLHVWLDELIEEVPCMWDGTQFTAAFSLNAADGYSYYCLLTSPGGNQLLPLATPNEPTSMEAVYLLSSISAYCNLVVYDWSVNDGELIVTDAYAQVQLPQISLEPVQITQSDIVVRLNGQEIDRIATTLSPSEVAGSYDVTIPSLAIPLPQLSEVDSLELYLEVSLSDGRNLRAFGINWYMEGSELTSAVG
jgi:hypothetical protein